MTEKTNMRAKEDPGGGGGFTLLWSCGPGAPLKNLDMPLDSRQQEQSELVKGPIIAILVSLNEYRGGTSVGEGVPTGTQA
jgi:hypothetical protein